MPSIFGLIKALPLLCMGISATPVFPSFGPADSSSGLTKRNLPKFGSDFNPNHLTELAQVKQGFADAIDLADKVLKTNAVDGPIFKRYFKDSDKAAVKGVFKAIYGDGSTFGSNEFNKLGIWYDDKADSPKSCKKTWLGKQVLAYLNHEVTGDGAQVVICPIGYKYPRLQDIDCGKVKDTVSGEMSSIGGILVHEFTHWKVLSGQAVNGLEIVDHGNEGYGPVNTYVFKNQVNNSPRLNADSYRWFAQEVWFADKCKKSYKPATDNAQGPCENSAGCVIQ
ncbi:MAG: hypothetical protein M1830_009842 [Pleopsidium flavum]|nr:MAG: hypothetical protein M1830_009842 [Pleopsidium flavum]